MSLLCGRTLSASPFAQQASTGVPVLSVLYCCPPPPVKFFSNLISVVPATPHGSTTEASEIPRAPGEASGVGGLPGVGRWLDHYTAMHLHLLHTTRTRSILTRMDLWDRWPDARHCNACNPSRRQGRFTAGTIVARHRRPGRLNHISPLRSAGGTDEQQARFHLLQAASEWRPAGKCRLTLPSARAS